MNSQFLGQYTRLEQHFLQLLTEQLNRDTRLVLQLLLRPGPSPELELMARLDHANQLVRVQVHGVRPVRYHLRTPNTPLGRKVRCLVSRALGESNLNLAASSQDGEDLSLLYHVHYPEDVLRQLG